MPIQVGLQERFVDLEGGLGAIGGGHDDELQASAGIAGDIESRDLRRRSLVVLQRDLARAGRAAEFFGEVRVLSLRGSEEDGIAWEKLAIDKPHAAQPIA